MSLLSERAMLAKLSISSWGGMMLDREVTDSANEEYKASKDAGRYNKRLVATSFFSGISTAHNGGRKAHKVLTLPWDDDGTRILTTQAYITYTSKMKECRLKAEAEVKKALQPENVTAMIAEAKIRLGDMFNSDDYPSVDELKEKFNFEVEIDNMPEAGDFRAQISDEAVKGIVKDIERRTDQRIKKATDDVFLRVKETVQHMKDKLRDYESKNDGKGKIIRQSVIYNVHEVAQLLPYLNMTNDPRFDELSAELLADLTENSSEILSADAKLRAQTISKADKLLKKVNQYLK